MAFVEYKNRHGERARTTGMSYNRALEKADQLRKDGFTNVTVKGSSQASSPNYAPKISWLGQ